MSTTSNILNCLSKMSEFARFFLVKLKILESYNVCKTFDKFPAFLLKFECMTFRISYIWHVPFKSSKDSPNHLTTLPTSSRGLI